MGCAGVLRASYDTVVRSVAFYTGVNRDSGSSERDSQEETNYAGQDCCLCPEWLSGLARWRSRGGMLNKLWHALWLTPLTPSMRQPVAALSSSFSRLAGCCIHHASKGHSKHLLVDSLYTTVMKHCTATPSSVVIMHT